MTTNDQNLTDAQVEALATIDRNGSSLATYRSWPARNMVHAATAKALVARGLCVFTTGGDGTFVQRVGA